MAADYDIPDATYDGVNPDPVEWANLWIKPAIIDLDARVTAGGEGGGVPVYATEAEFNASVAPGVAVLHIDSEANWPVLWDLVESDAIDAVAHTAVWPSGFVNQRVQGPNYRKTLARQGSLGEGFSTWEALSFLRVETNPGEVYTVDQFGDGRWMPPGMVVLPDMTALEALGTDRSYFGTIAYSIGSDFPGITDLAGTATTFAPFESLVTYDYNNYPNQYQTQEIHLQGKSGPMTVRRERTYDVTTSGAWSAWSAWAPVVAAGFVPGSVFFEGTLSGGQNLGQSSFISFPINAITTNLGGGAFNTSTYIYTIPETGLYDCQATVRIGDSSSPRSFGLGIATANADGPHFLWGTMGVGMRDAKQYRRLTRFTSGDQVRLYIYSDGADFYATAGNLVIMKVAD